MRQQRPGAPWRKRAPRGHGAGPVDDARPAAEPPAELRREEPEVVALHLGGGRSWEDLLSEAVDDDEAVPEPGSGPVEPSSEAGADPDTAVEDEPVGLPTPVDLAETATDREAAVDAPGTPRQAVTAPLDRFGEVLSDVVLPGGRRVTRYRLPQD